MPHDYLIRQRVQPLARRKLSGDLSATRFQLSNERKHGSLSLRRRRLGRKRKPNLDDLRALLAAAATASKGQTILITLR